MVHRPTRVLAVLVTVACALAIVFALLPGKRTYTDRNRCAERPSALFAVTHSGQQPPCTGDWVEDGTALAGGLATIVLLVATGLVGVLVARLGRPLGGLVWSVVTWIGSIATAVMTFQIDVGDWWDSTYTTTLWPTSAMIAMLLAVYGLLLVLGIVAFVAFGAEERARRPAPAPLPRAIVR